MLKSFTSDEGGQEDLESGNVLPNSRKSGPVKTGKSSTKKSSTKKSGPKKSGSGKSSTKKPTVVAVRLLKNVRYKIRGVSGKEYVFNGAGSVLSIDSEDVDLLMKKNENRPNSCCGGVSPSKVFELV